MLLGRIPEDDSRKVNYKFSQLFVFFQQSFGSNVLNYLLQLRWLIILPIAPRRGSHSHC
jgi:hypothetical protein